MSHFLYVHKDLSGNPDWNKVGVTITPYTAVRTRQKFCSSEFQLDHLFFGRESHIERLETSIKEQFKELSGKHLTGRGQTELFKVSQEMLLESINAVIQNESLQVHKVVLKKPYSASRSGDCPFNVPSEDRARRWADTLVESKWGEDPELELARRLFKGLRTC
jgi:hypothetical protein